jgi:hypothetical protein
MCAAQRTDTARYVSYVPTWFNTGPDAAGHRVRHHAPIAMRACAGLGTRTTSVNTS